MKLKLFIYTFAAVLIFARGVSAGIVGPQKEFSDNGYIEPVSETVVTARHEQKYGIKDNQLSSIAPAVSDNNKEKHVENTSENSENNENADANNDNDLNTQGTLCQTDEEKTLFCVNKDGKPLSGRRVVTKGKGLYVSTEFFKNGYLNGLCVYYDENGMKKESIYYRMGIRDGVYKAYYPNEGVKIWANYKNGLLEGNLDVLNQSGKLRGRMRYRRGFLEKGFCNINGKKDNFSDEMLKSFPFNVINDCGIQI